MTRNTYKIGILVTPSVSSESIKNETYRVERKDRPWLKFAPKNLTMKNSTDGNRVHVASDTAIGAYLLWLSEQKNMNLVVDIIPTSEFTAARCAQSQIVFIPMIDILEHRTIAPKTEHLRFCQVMKSATNIYPSYKDVQALINRKDLYYHYFHARKIPMIDTYPITRELWKRYGSSQMIKKIRSHAKSHKWERMIVKPASGQEGLYFTALHPDVDDDRLANSIEEILKLYEAVLLQEYIKGFDKRNLEARCYSIGGRQAYTILTNSNALPGLPKEEGGKVKYPLYQAVKALARKVMSKIPSTRIHGIKLPPLLYRVDIGNYPDTRKLFCNEIECFPSSYTDGAPKGVIYEKLIAEAILRIMHCYTSKLRRKTKFKITPRTTSLRNQSHGSTKKRAARATSQRRLHRTRQK